MKTGLEKKDVNDLERSPGFDCKSSSWVVERIERLKHHRRWGLQAFIKGAMEQIECDQSMFRVYDIGTNNIGEKGCEYISKSKW